MKDHVKFSSVNVGCKNEYVYIGKNSYVDTQAQFSFTGGVIGIWDTCTAKAEMTQDLQDTHASGSLTGAQVEIIVISEGARCLYVDN